MIIDVHGHVSAPSQLYVYKANILAHRGAHGRGKVKVSDEELIAAARDKPNDAFGGISHIQHLDEASIDTQFISPRPYQMMHSEKPGKLVRWFTEETNELIARQCELFDGRFRAVAGLPQYAGEPLDDAVAELERCVTELGFVGCVINPDPTEGQGPTPPGLGDRYWYPLYEKLCELDVPAQLHSAGCRSPRESYSVHFITEETIAIAHLMDSKVFDDFPDLKLIISHAGGAIPYQIGRFQVRRMRTKPELGPWEDSLRKLYFDTCLYTKASIELLLRTVGIDRCLFGSEKPGTGSVRDPETGVWRDDVGALVRDIDWLTDEDLAALFEGNVRSVFGLEA